MSEVLKEHYGYLSDAIRQQRFAVALSRVVRPGDRVVDVGCGFGVLGLLCLKAGAAHVWGIDRTAAILRIIASHGRVGASLRQVTVGSELPGERVEVVTGLVAGEKVVRSGP